MSLINEHDLCPDCGGRKLATSQRCRPCTQYTYAHHDEDGGYDCRIGKLCDAAGVEHRHCACGLPMARAASRCGTCLEEARRRELSAAKP